MQTTLLGLAIAFIVALIAALIGPYFIDWNQFRPQFEAEASRVIGSQVRVGGAFDARLLPTPSLRLHTVTVGGANDLGKVRADKLDVEFSLASLMRGEWRANELTVNGMALDLGLDSNGRIDWPASNGKFNLGTLAVDRLNLTGRIALHDAASRTTLELNDIVFSGDVRALAGAIRGDGNFTLSGARYPFRVSSGQSADGAGTRVHLNVDPGARALSAELDGVLSFEARAPRFDGAIVLAVPPGLKAQGDAKGDIPITPWRISAKVKADPSAAKFDSVEASYGAEESALKVAGTADMRFGAASLLHAALSARQLDLDRFTGKDSTAAEPFPLLPGLRALMAGIPQAPLPAQLEFNFEQVILGGRPLQNLAAELRADAKSWRVDRLDLQAPGATHLALSRANAAATNLVGAVTGALSIESSDPDMLVAWLQGRREIVYRSQKPLRLRGDVGVTADRVSIEAMKAEIDGGAVEGRLALSNLPARGGTRFEAELKAERLDLDAAAAFVHSLAGPQADWPDEAQLSLESGSATSGGQDVRPLKLKLGYSPNAIVLDQLKFGEAGGATMEGAGRFDRVGATGRLALNANAASLGQITGWVAPLAPALASRLDALESGPGPAHLNLTLALDRNSAERSEARLVLDLDTPQLKGVATLAAKPKTAAVLGIDFVALAQSEIDVEAKFSSEKGAALLTSLGLDRAIAVGEGPVQFAGSVTGTWRAPLRVNAKISGTGLEAEAQGNVEPWAQDAKGSVNLKIRSANLAPLFGLKPSDVSAQNVNLSSQVSLKGGRLIFENMDGAISGTRLRGRIALSLDDERNVEGEIGLDAFELAPAFALAIGASGRETTEPLGGGWWKGWRGRVGFQALRGALPGGAELRPVSGALKNDGQSLTFESIKGGIGGGEASGEIDVKPGVAVNARVELVGVDGAAMRYRALTMPAGRASLRMTLASQGRSASALTGALSGEGIVTLQSASIAGLDPRAFDAAIRASDSGQATDDVKLRRVVEPVLSAGALSVASAQIPFTIGDGRLRVGVSTLDAEGARAIVSGGYDIPADQADIRVTLASTAAGTATRLPEIQLFATGSPDRLDRTVDVATLSSWLAVRAIDRETRRLDSIDRGEPPPLPALPASTPPPAAALPASGAPDVVPSEQSSSEGSGRDSRRGPAKPKFGVPRPPAPSSPSNAPVVTQQLAPLPPPIEVRPAPGAVRPQRPRQPLVLTPPVATPPPSAF